MNPRQYLLALVTVLFLAGCTVLGSDPATINTTPKPLPTTNPDEGLRVINSPACLAYTLPTIQVDEESGDMLAWSLDGTLLAYVTPENDQWGWYAGDLTFLTLDTGETRATRDLKVTGDLTWSPDGSLIAFTALETTNNVYTVLVLQVSDFTIIDLYSAGAATDEYGSQKAILRWADNSRVQVVETCGVDCSRVVEISIRSQEQRLVENARKQDNNGLKIVLNQGQSIINEDWQLANLSPDDTKMFFSDDDDLPWVAVLKERVKYRLDLGINDAIESKWSPDSNLLAIRTNQNVYIYDLACSMEIPDGTENLQP